MTTALYRRYRPETFAEVVGQDHVTAPLRQALRSGQTNHAYLFSGPRGCGKTTSARILARCLNCAQGPTDTPCGVCPSCVELARGGPGSLDVVEIDAASHGGVDDARDLRERATFAPARDRYKVFILDEAHMVSPQGFNALLKIVEEPPEHVKFIFATTEPDKVIGTIRSRTHHYPFRLVPPDVMVGYLDQLCTAEGVTVGSGVLPLVVRAGGGSVRDSLSVLDQLIAGSGPDGLGYEDAVALLGYTHASLLDDLVEAVAARDGASAFRVVERVISTGHEPRRFVEDLLERLRDLIVLAASGEAAAAVLRDVPGDQMARMQTQARQLGAAELSRSADLTNAALSEMTGATSPRLHLELLMARLLLPALDDSAAGLGARVDRLEREGVRVATGGAPGSAPAAAAAPATVPVGAATAATAPAPVATAATAQAPVATGVPSAPAPAVPVERVAVVTPAPQPLPAAASEAPTDPDAGRSTGGATPPAAPTTPLPASDADPAGPGAAAAGRGADAAPAVVDPHDERVVEPPAPADQVVPAAGPVAHDVPTAEPVAPAEREPGAPGGGDTEMLRRRWPEVLDTLGRLKKTTWVLISQNAQVVELDATTLTLGFGAPGLASAFRGGSHADLVQQAVRETLGFSVKVEGVLAGPDASGPARGGAPTPGPAPTAPGGAPSTAEATASWGAPAARPAPAPAPTAETRRSPGAPPAADAAPAGDAADEDPDAVVDPWSAAVTSGTPGTAVADDRGTDDRGTDDRGTDDRGTDDRGTDGRGTDDRGTDGRGTDDRGTDGRGTDGRGTDGRGTDGRGTDDRGTDGRGTDDRGTDGRGTDGRGTDGRGTDDRGTDDRGTDGRGTDDRGTDGRGTDDRGTDDRGTDGRGADDDAARPPAPAAAVATTGAHASVVAAASAVDAPADPDGADGADRADGADGADRADGVEERVAEPRTTGRVAAGRSEGEGPVAGGGAAGRSGGEGPAVEGAAGRSGGEGPVAEGGAAGRPDGARAAASATGAGDVAATDPAAAAPVRPQVAVADDAWPEVRVPGGSTSATAAPAAPAPSRAAVVAPAARVARPGPTAPEDVDWPEVHVPGGAPTAGGAALGSVAVDGAPAGPAPTAARPGVGAAPDAAPAASGAERAPGNGTRPAAGTTARPAAGTTAHPDAGATGRGAGSAPPWDVDPQDPGAPEPPPDDDWAAVEPPMPDGPPDEGRGARRPAPAAPASPPAPTAPAPSGADRVRAARAAAAAGAAAAAAEPARNRWADDEPSMDDPDIGANGLSGVPLVVQVLRATVIEELVDEGY